MTNEIPFNFDEILKKGRQDLSNNDPTKPPANQHAPTQQTSPDFNFGDLTSNNGKPLLEVRANVGSVPELVELLKHTKHLRGGPSTFVTVIKGMGVSLLLLLTLGTVLETQSSPKVRAKIQNLVGLDIGDPRFSPLDAYAKKFGKGGSAERLNSDSVLEFEKNTTGVGVAASGGSLLPEGGNDAYFLKRQQVAINESKFGIMPSVTLVQGRIESGAGTSRLATEGNNHFGMKYGTYNTIVNAGNNLARYIPHAPKKHKPILIELFQHVEYVKQNFNGSSNHSDDYGNESFVNFKTPESSFAAHTLLLLFGVKKVASGNANVVRIQGRYLPFLSASDFRGQLAAIKIAGYATEESYHLYGIKGIEKSGINKLDQVNLQRNRLIEEAIMGYFARLSTRVR